MVEDEDFAGVDGLDAILEREGHASGYGEEKRGLARCSGHGATPNGVFSRSGGATTQPTWCPSDELVSLPLS